jgi:hypothetical protein
LGNTYISILPHFKAINQALVYCFGVIVTQVPQLITFFDCCDLLYFDTIKFFIEFTKSKIYKIMQVKATVALNNTTQFTAKVLLHKISIKQKNTINDDKQNASISFLLKVLIRNFMLFGNTIFNSLNIFIIQLC